MNARTGTWVLGGTVALAVVVAASQGSGPISQVAERRTVGRISAPDLFEASEALPEPKDNSRFVSVTLPLGVSLDLPRSWRILDAGENEVIQTGAEAALNLSGEATDWSSNELLLAANSMPLTTYAAVRLNAVSPPIVDPAEARSLTAEDVAYLGHEIVKSAKELLPRSGLYVLDDLGAQVVFVGVHPSLNVAYRRTGPKGPVIVHIVQVYGPSTTLKVNLSYRESEQVLWLATLRRIAASLHLPE